MTADERRLRALEREEDDSGSARTAHDALETGLFEIFSRLFARGRCRLLSAWSLGARPARRLDASRAPAIGHPGEGASENHQLLSRETAAAAPARWPAVQRGEEPRRFLGVRSEPLRRAERWSSQWPRPLPRARRPSPGRPDRRGGRPSVRDPDDISAVVKARRPGMRYV